MGTLLKFVITLYILSLIFGMFCALVRFLIDVAKWHDKEEKVHITPSEFEADLNESEVIPDVGADTVVTESGEHNSPTVSIPWSES